MLTPNSVLFVSDVHLSERTPALTQLFLEFLRGPAQSSQALYILGDLFDVWVGEDLLLPFHQDLQKALNELHAKGVSVYFIPGNRDFLASSSFLKKMTLTALPERAIIDLHGIPTLLMHGDLLCTQDKGYQVYRKIAQHPLVRFVFLLLPRRMRSHVAQKLRQKSQQYQQAKSLEIMDAVPETVENQMSQYGIRQLIHGHVHRANIHTHHVDGHIAKRIVLGDWKETVGNVVICTPKECILAQLDPGNAITPIKHYALEDFDLTET